MTNSYYVRLHQDCEIDSDEYVYSESSDLELARERAISLGVMGFGRADVMVRSRNDVAVLESYVGGVRIDDLENRK